MTSRASAMPDRQAALVGKRVLAGLTLGRRKAIAEAKARAACHAALILDLALVDQAAGRPAWGRSGRLARKIGLSQSQVQRYLRRLFSARTASVQNRPQQTRGGSPR